MLLTYNGHHHKAFKECASLSAKVVLLSGYVNDTHCARLNENVVPFCGPVDDLVKEQCEQTMGMCLYF